MKLIKLNKELHPQLIEMMDEWSREENIIPYSITKGDYHDINTYMDAIEVKKSDDLLVKDSTFFLFDEDNDRFIGAVNIRHELNDNLMKYGGHIGDGIRPSFRGMGYGNLLVKLAIDKCQNMGIKHILITCEKDNIASAKTIMNNGGILENEVFLDNKIIQRYWVDLK